VTDRTVRYRVEIDTASARREAQELGRIFTQEMNRAAGGAAAGAGGAMPAVAGAGGMSTGGKLGAMALGGLGALGGYVSVQQLKQATIEMANLSVQMTRARNAFAALSGGAGEAEKKLAAIRQAAGGTMDSVTAMNVANRMAALGMANSAQEMERAVTVGRKIAAVMGGDVTTTLENLAMAASNLSFVRLDQMGIAAQAVRVRMKELTEANKELGQEQAFLQAAMQVAEKTFKDIDLTAAGTVSGLEQLTVAWTELKIVVAEGPVGQGANALIGGIATGVQAATDLITKDVDRLTEEEEMARLATNDLTMSIAALTDKIQGGVDVTLEDIKALAALRVQMAELEGQAYATAAAVASVPSGPMQGAMTLEQAQAAAGAASGLWQPAARPTLAQWTEGVGGWVNMPAADVADRTRANVEAAQAQAEAQRQREGDTRREFNDWNRAYAQKQAADAEKAARGWESAAKATEREMTAAAKAMVDEFKAGLQAVPGLFGTTSVTAEDMAAAAGGYYEEKPDEWLRRLAAEVGDPTGKTDFPNADIGDAKARAGLPASMPDAVALARIQSMWADQSLFAGGKNTDLINMAAAQRDLDRQAASKSGREAIFALFGMPSTDEGMKALAAQGMGAAGVTADGGQAVPALDPALLAGLQAQMTNGPAMDALKGAGDQVAGFLYEGFKGGIGARDWRTPLVDAITNQVTAQALANINAALNN